MMNDEKTLNGLTITALVLGLLLVVGHTFMPKANPAKTKAAREREQIKMRAETRDARDRIAKLKEQNAVRVWEASASQMGPVLMSRVTGEARKAELKVIAFRPQRTEELAGLMKTPYVITLEGPYGKVVQFARDLETNEQRLSVTSIQCASSDGATDAVSATVNVVAFRVDPPAKKTEPEKETTDAKNPTQTSGKPVNKDEKPSSTPTTRPTTPSKP
jgi:Tfp pilus assembly protein PilO